MTRPYNFSAGPAAMPEDVLQQAAQEMLNWRGTGMSVMEMSHRGKDFISIYERAQADFRALMSVPEHFKILFMQGGGLGENAIVPMNLSRGEAADFVVTGSWSAKSAQEARKYCSVHVAASNEGDAHTTLPAPQTWKVRQQARYVHVCTNETIHGVEFLQWPDLKALGCDAPLVVDFSSHVASCPVDWGKIGVAFAGAQKNIGPAGLTLVVVREDLMGHAMSICPTAFDYACVAKHDSMYNTPPTYAIYMAGLTFEWIQRQREGELQGVAALQKRSHLKSELLYQAIDQSSLYESRVHPSCRSRMNVPFFLRDERLNEAFLEGARQNGLLQLKGHKSVGGMRASLYNAMPVQGVQALVAYMQEFEKTKA